jgi:hypothetical protein
MLAAVTSPVVDMHGVPVLVYEPDGPQLSASEILDLIGEAMLHQAQAVSLPVQRCPDGFFDLSSGVAGEVVQKFVNYRLRLAIVGDVSDRAARSSALRDFIRETNRGNQIWFVTTSDELAERHRSRA